MGRQVQARLLLVAACHVAATLSITLLYRRLGQPIGLFGLMTVLVSALSFGVKGGLISASLQSALNTAVMQLVLDPPERFTGEAFIGILAYFVLGVVAGNQRDLSRRLGDELRRNEQLRVREQETLAAIPDAMIRVARDGSCGLQGMSLPDSLEQVTERALGRALTEERHKTIRECINLVRSTGQEQGLTFESPGASAHDLRFLPTVDGSVLVVARDVTEQRKLLRRATTAENLASLGTLAAGLAHEINNPLTYVITSISTAKQDLPSSAEAAHAELTAALDGCWRIRDLVRNILQNTNSRTDATETVHVPEVIDTALTLVRSQVQPRATVHWQPEEVPFAAAHRTKLVQVLVNLVVNASQAFTNAHASQNHIRIRAYSELEQVVIEVSDNGPGMDEAVRQRALEPFFTTKEPGQGSGLGLFLCNSIVESLGGTITLDSELGLGTTVSVRLPVADEPPKSRVTVYSLPSPGSDATPQLRVLIVDDEPQIRRALRRILSRTCTVALCNNGAEAQALFSRGEKFDVILCDVLMPEMTGMDLFHWLTQEYPAQAERMLLVTGGATSDETRRFLAKHANRVVNKPFIPADVETAVRSMARFPMPIATLSLAPPAVGSTPTQADEGAPLSHEG